MLDINTKFKYITEDHHDSEDVMFELVYQVKRIADELERMRIGGINVRRGI